MTVCSESKTFSACARTFINVTTQTTRSKHVKSCQLNTVPSDSAVTLSCVATHTPDARRVLLSEQTTDAIAFTAYANRSRLYNLGELVLFDSVITNEGGFYQEQLSYFVCPVDGLYVFSVSVASLDTIFEANLMREGQYLVTSRAHATYSDQGMVMAVTECSADERVWVELGANDVGTLISNSTLRTSTFSGYLLTY